MDFTSPKNKHGQTIADTVDRMIMPQVEYIDEFRTSSRGSWKEFTSSSIELRPKKRARPAADTITLLLFYWKNWYRARRVSP